MLMRYWRQILVFKWLLLFFKYVIYQVENWMAEKLQLATEESYRDPANIQSKHQKHQAFEAELAANADRIQVTFLWVLVDK